MEDDINSDGFAVLKAASRKFSDNTNELEMLGGTRKEERKKSNLKREKHYDSAGTKAPAPFFAFADVIINKLYENACKWQQCLQRHITLFGGGPTAASNRYVW